MDREALNEETQPRGRTPEQDLLWKIVGLCRKAWKEEIDFFNLHHPVEASCDKAISAEEEIHKLAMQYAAQKAIEAVERVVLERTNQSGYNRAIDDLEAVKQKVIEGL